MLYKIFYTIINTEHGIKTNKISNALDYIEMNFASDITISELARLCNLGECMFRRYFKEYTGTSPVKYRNRLRISKAYDYLVTEGLPVSEVMELTGFYDASYFNKIFKSIIGKTPSECRKST